MTSPRIANKRAIVDLIARRQVDIPTKPYEVQFSTEHRCNLKCVQCGATVERNRGIVPLMDRRLPVRALERFRKIEHALPYFEWLSLTGSGEPLISPDLPAILEITSEHDVPVAFNTNGTLWNRERAEMVVDRGVDEIRFSIDAGTKETFEKIRVQAKWEKVLEAVRTLVAVKAERRSQKPRVTVSSNLMRQSIEELPLLVDLAADLGVERLIANNTIIYEPAMQQEALVYHRPLVARMVREAQVRARARGLDFVNQLHDLSDDDDGVDAPIAETTPAAVATPTPPIAAAPVTTPMDAAVPEFEGATAVAVAAPVSAASTSAFEVPKSPCSTEAETPEARSLDVESILPPLQGLPADLPAIVHACQRPWTGLYVENNGWVRVCCFDAPPIGNLDEQTLDEIWNGPQAQHLRRSFLDDKPPEACVNCFIFAKAQASEDVFVQKVDSGKCYIDSPGLDPRVGGVHTVRGWALEFDTVDHVEVCVDDATIGTARCEHDRPDVAAAYPGFSVGARCGFEFALDTTRISAGDHVLRLRIHTRTGRVCEGTERVIRVVH